MQTALSLSTFPLSAAARPCSTLRQVDLRVTCSGPDTLASRLQIWIGLIGGTEALLMPSSGHTRPDEWRTTRNHLANPSVRVSSGTVSPAAQRTILFGSSRLLQICPDFEMLLWSQRFLDSVDRDKLLRSDLLAHTHTQNTDKSSTSHHGKFMIHDQTDQRPALAVH